MSNENLEKLNDTFKLMARIVDSAATWEDKWAPFWDAQCVAQCLTPMRWCDPDTSEQEDITACYLAWKDHIVKVNENPWMVKEADK